MNQPSLECPKCGLWSPPGALRCDCGYDFSTGQAPAVDQPRSRPEEPAGPLMRWYMAAGYAASEVGGLLALLWIIGLISGARRPGILIDVGAIVMLATWLW